MKTWLADKSALVRLGSSSDIDKWTDRIERGLVRLSVVTLLEIGFSARSGRELRGERLRAPVASMPPEYLTPRTEDRAVEVQVLLADKGQHRAVSIPDLLVAAAAEMAGHTVLHFDKDFELIAKVTRQPMERLRV